MLKMELKKTHDLKAAQKKEKDEEDLKEQMHKLDQEFLKFK